MLDKLCRLYKEIGTKIKIWAVWMFIIEAVGAVIAGFAMILEGGFLVGLLTLILGPAVAWVSTWLLYAFGQLVDDTHAIRGKNETINRIDKNIQAIAQPMLAEAEERTKHEAEESAKQRAEERAKREAEEKAKQEADAITKRKAEEAPKKAEQQLPKKEKTLSEKLAYALQYQSDEGMIGYLKNIQDESVQNILNSPQHLIRDQIQNLLSNM